MGKVSKFMIVSNPMANKDAVYILCTRDPAMLIKVNTGPGREFTLEMEELFKGTPEEAHAALKRAHDWYIAYLAQAKTK